MAQFDEYIEARDVKWTPELEVALFHSMHGHKPVGEPKKVHDYLSAQSRYNSLVCQPNCLI